MIKVIKGTVGTHINGRNIARSAQDEPFSLSEEAEARFVALGVAAYYTSGCIGPNTGSNTPKETAITSGSAQGSVMGNIPESIPAADEESDDEDDDTLETMGFPELRNLAKQMGLSASGKREDIIARINEANKVEL